jgi:hypothetical protein
MTVFPEPPIDTTNLYGYQKAALFAEAMQRAGRISPRLRAQGHRVDKD